MDESNRAKMQARAVLSSEFGPFKILQALISSLSTQNQPSFVTPSH